MSRDNEDNKYLFNNLKLDRRKFLKVSGAVVGVTAVMGTTGCKALKQSTGTPKPVIKAEPINYETFQSSCAMECLHCNLTAFVKDGKVEKVETSKDFHTIGCLRGISRTQWLNHENRIKMPMLRTGEKGKGKFKEISWDEALDLMEKNIRDTIDKHGNSGLFLEAASGNMDSITNGIAGRFFEYLGGATRPDGSLCCSAVTSAMVPMLGGRYIDTRDTIKDSKYILCWANNPAVTMQAYFKDYEEAMRNGAKMVVIDPRFNETAAKADEWIPICPSTDAALGLGMINVIIKENLIDREFLLNHTGAVYLVDQDTNLVRLDDEDEDSYLVFDTISKTVIRHDTPNIQPALSSEEATIPRDYRTVFDLIKAEASVWTLEKTEAETDVPKETIERIAKGFATSEASMLIQNMGGAQRSEFGTYVSAAQFYLSLLTGQIGKPGTGICDAGGATQFVKINTPVPAPPKKPSMTKIPVAKIGESIYNGDPYEIGFWYIQTTNAMTQVPNTNMVKKALQKVPFVVVADNIMSSTALFADLVLPVTGIFEFTSLMAGTRSHYIQLMEKAVEAPGEAKPDHWIFAQLAKRFGFGEVFDKPIEDLIEECLKDSGVTLAQIKEGPVKPVSIPSVPFADGQFRTSTKKAHLFIEQWKEKNHSPVLTYIQAEEFAKNKNSELVKKYPLMAIQKRVARNINSSFNNLPWVLEAHGDKPRVMMHPEDANERNISEGEWIKVYNDRGYHKAIANVSTHIKKGVISLENGWWEQQGGSTSYLTNDKVEALGSGTSINNTLVEIIREV